MNLTETAKIIKIMTLSFPNYKPEDMEGTVQVWQYMLKDYTYNDINMALETYTRGNTSGFAPAISQLINLVHRKVEITTEMTESEAWALVRKAISNAIYHAQEEFEKLPPIIQKVVGSANMLKMWAQTDIDQLETVIQSNFMRSYRSEVSKQREIARMPVEIRNQIEQKQQEKIEAKDV